MKTKVLRTLMLVLICVLSGCRERRATSVPSAPDAEEIRTWAGFPAGFKLTTETSDAKADRSFFGKPIWGVSYDNSTQSLVTIGIIVCEPGTLWGTNRARMTKAIEEQMAKMRAIKNPDGSKTIDFITKSFQVVTLPNGRKAYFTPVGFGPGGTSLGAFSFERNYDLFVMEDFGADDVSPEKKMKNPVSPTNDLPSLFGKIEAFLEGQKK
jgi:hypothetical protein